MSSERAAEDHSTIYVFQTEPEATAQRTSMAMNHVRIIDLSYSLSHSRCLLQRTDNTTSIYLVDQLE